VLRDAGFDMTPIFFYSIPGLEFIAESIAYYEKVLFGGKRILQFPEAAFYKWLNSGLFQTPNTFEVIKAANLRTPTHGEWWSACDEWARIDSGVADTSLTAVGIRADDSPMRRVNVAKNGPIRRGVRNWLPVWDYSMAQVTDTIRKSGVSLPIDYKLFGRSFSGGLDVRYMVPLKQHLPHDYEKVLRWFPLVEAQVWKYERYVNG
jgi:hypothetical protein